MSAKLTERKRRKFMREFTHAFPAKGFFILESGNSNPEKRVDQYFKITYGAQAT